MELDVLRPLSLVQATKEIRQHVMHSLETVFLVQTLQQLQLLMHAKIEPVLQIPQLKVILNVRHGYRHAFGKEAQDARTHNLALHLQVLQTLVPHLQQMMDPAMEQEQLLHQPHVLPTFAHLHLQPTIPMLNAKVGDQHA